MIGNAVHQHQLVAHVLADDVLRLCALGAAVVTFNYVTGYAEVTVAGN